MMSVHEFWHMVTLPYGVTTLLPLHGHAWCRSALPKGHVNSINQARFNHEKTGKSLPNRYKWLQKGLMMSHCIILHLSTGEVTASHFLSVNPLRNSHHAMHCIHSLNPRRKASETVSRLPSPNRWQIKLHMMSGITLWPWIKFLARFGPCIDWLTYGHRVRPCFQREIFLVANLMTPFVADTPHEASIRVTCTHRFNRSFP